MSDTIFIPRSGPAEPEMSPWDGSPVMRPPGLKGRTFRAEFNGRASWVKLAERKTRFPLAPGVQRLLERTGLPEALRCTFIHDRSRALVFEAGRLRDLKARGFAVPEILHEDKGKHLVLSDTGLSVWDRLKTGASFDVIDRAVFALADLHLRGEFHGQPYPKNMTCDGRKISFIDLEDDSLAVMPLATAQMRDVWLMVHGHWPFARAEPSIGRRIVNTYNALTGGNSFEAHMPAMRSVHAKLIHTGMSADVGDNLRRYRWTLGAFSPG